MSPCSIVASVCVSLMLSPILFLRIYPTFNKAAGVFIRTLLTHVTEDGTETSSHRLHRKGKGVAPVVVEGWNGSNSPREGYLSLRSHQSGGFPAPQASAGGCLQPPGLFPAECPLQAKALSTCWLAQGGLLAICEKLLVCDEDLSRFCEWGRSVARRKRARSDGPQQRHSEWVRLGSSCERA